MSTVATAGQVLASELDRVLRLVDEADAIHREAWRSEQIAMSRLSALSDEARRLRLSMWALEGRDEGQGASGEANSANHERRMELRKEATDGR